MYLTPTLINDAYLVVKAIATDFCDHSTCRQKSLELIYTLCIMPCSRSGPGNESYQNKADGLTLNLFLQFCALIQVNIILKNI